MRINSTIPHFVIYPRNGLVANGVRFVTSIYKLDGPARYEVGDEIEKQHVLRTWWRSLTDHECKRMHADGVTLDRVVENLDVIQLS